MILSKKFKEEIDKIVMNEEIKKRILHNVINENIEVKSIMPTIRKHYLLRRNIQIVAACFTLIVCLNVVKSYPQLFKHENDNFQQDKISKDTDDKNENLQSIEESKSYDNNKDSKEQQIINHYTGDNETQSTKYDKNSSLNKNKNSSNTEVEEKSSVNSALNSSTSPKSSVEPQTDANTEKVNPVGSDNIQKDTSEKQDEVIVQNSNENEQANSQLGDCGPIITDYKTLEEAESVAKLKINSLKVLPKGFNIANIGVISNEIIEITYSNNEENIITFRAGKDIDNISGDYDIYEVKNLYEINGIDINLEGNKNKVVNLANWKKDNISYSISSIDGIDEEIALNMIKSSL